MMTLLGLTLNENTERLISALGQSADLQTLSLAVAGRRIQASLLYLEGLVDPRLIQEGLIAPLQRASQLPPDLRSLAAANLQAPQWSYTDQSEEALNSLMRGNALLLVDGMAGALALAAQGGEARRPEEPIGEQSVRGPHDGFTEALKTNRALIRRRIANPNLHFENVSMGQQSNTQVNIAFMTGQVATEVLEEVRKRLRAIPTTGILDAGMVQEWLDDNPLSPFPLIDHTGRPDKAAAALMSGRVVILTDQSPSALIAPTVFWDYLHVPEDYYERWWVASLLRVLRLTTMSLSLLLPSIWVTLISYHQELLPTPLALSIAGGREKVPLPAFIETLAMEFTFEIIQEAGLRLPRILGQMVSIVGALVIGQAAVQAGLVSPANVIIVAMTGIASFATPSFSAAYAVRLLRFVMLLSSGFLGILGLGFVFMAVLMHLLQLKSFGVDFVSPVLPYKSGAASEAVTRPPWTRLRTSHKRWWAR